MIRLRVLHVLKYFRPDFTGEGVFLERMTPVLDVIDASVEHELLVTLTPRPRRDEPVSASLQRVHYLTSRAVRHARGELKLLLWLVLHLHRYRVVHFHTHADRYFLAYALAKLFGRRVILSATLDDSVPAILETYRPERRQIARRMFSFVDAFVAISPKLHQKNQSLVGARSHLLPVGIVIPKKADRAARDAQRRRQGFAPDDVLVIFVGGICERKDPAFLVEMMPRLLAHCPRLKLVIVGPVLEPDYYRRIEAFVA